MPVCSWGSTFGRSRGLGWLPLSSGTIEEIGFVLVLVAGIYGIKKIAQAVDDSIDAKSGSTNTGSTGKSCSRPR
jgi:hypothetical protein